MGFLLVLLIQAAVIVIYRLANTKGIPCSYSFEGKVRRDNVDERGPFFEGDMIIKSFDSTTSTSSNLFERATWPNAQLVYTIDPSFLPHEVDQITTAFRDISSKTCVTFRQRSLSPNRESDYVFIQRGGFNSGCWSFVGRVGGRQILNLEAPLCIHSGNIAHELLHSLNRMHEQSRFDRDDYIYINYTDIQPGAEGNFKRLSSEELNTFGVPYDYNSIMHYSAYAFAKSPFYPTIIPRQSGVTIGQRIALSQRDAHTINLLYRCANP